MLGFVPLSSLPLSAVPAPVAPPPPPPAPTTRYGNLGAWRKRKPRPDLVKLHEELEEALSNYSHSSEVEAALKEVRIAALTGTNEAEIVAVRGAIQAAAESAIRTSKRRRRQQHFLLLLS